MGSHTTTVRSTRHEFQFPANRPATQRSPLRLVSSGLKPTKRQRNAVELSLAVSAKEEALALPAVGFRVAVTAFWLPATASVCQAPLRTIEPYSSDCLAGVDNVLQFTIVTADGNHVVANQFNNQDLFWALRGGGGGTWGVVTSVTYKTHPSTPFSGAFLLVNSTDANSTQKLLTELIRLTPSLVDQGYGGYSGGGSNQFQLLTASPNATAEQTNATFRPLFDLALSLPGFTVQNYTVTFPDFWALYEPLWGSTDGQVGVPNEISSWLLPKDVIQTDKPEDLAAELLKISGFAYLSVPFCTFSLP